MHITDITRNDILEILSDDGSMEVAHIQAMIMERKRQKYLHMHPYAIGYNEQKNSYYTHLPDSTKPSGRRQISRKNLTELENLIIEPA